MGQTLHPGAGWGQAVRNKALEWSYHMLWWEAALADKAWANDHLTRSKLEENPVLFPPLLFSGSSRKALPCQGPGAGQALGIEVGY